MHDTSQSTRYLCWLCSSSTIWHDVDVFRFPARDVRPFVKRNAQLPYSDAIDRFDWRPSVGQPLKPPRQAQSRFFIGNTTGHKIRWASAWFRSCDKSSAKLTQLRSGRTNRKLHVIDSQRFRKVRQKYFLNRKLIDWILSSAILIIKTKTSTKRIAIRLLKLKLEQNNAKNWNELKHVYFMLFFMYFISSKIDLKEISTSLSIYTILCWNSEAPSPSLST